LHREGKIPEIGGQEVGEPILIGGITTVGPEQSPKKSIRKQNFAGRKLERNLVAEGGRKDLLRNFAKLKGRPASGPPEDARE